MIATRTMSVMVTMALLGVVPVVAHAQQVVDLDQLVTQSGTATSTSEPAQTQTQTVNDQDTNINTASNTPINFAIFVGGPFNSGTATSNPTLNSPFTFAATDDDTNTNVGEQNQNAPVTQSVTQDQTQEQNPGFPVSSVTDIASDIFPGAG